MWVVIALIQIDVKIFFDKNILNYINSWLTIIYSTLILTSSNLIKLLKMN